MRITIISAMTAFGLVAAVDYYDGRMDIVQSGIDTVKNLGEEVYAIGEDAFNFVTRSGRQLNL